MSLGLALRQFGLYGIDFLLELRAGEREAISLAPWLQPGRQVLQNDSLNRFQRFLLILQQQKPLETVPRQCRFAVTGLKPRC